MSEVTLRTVEPFLAPSMVTTGMPAPWRGIDLGLDLRRVDREEDDGVDLRRDHVLDAAGERRHVAGGVDHVDGPLHLLGLGLEGVDHFLGGDRGEIGREQRHLLAGGLGRSKRGGYHAGARPAAINIFCISSPSFGSVVTLAAQTGFRIPDTRHQAVAFAIAEELRSALVGDEIGHWRTGFW